MNKIILMASFFCLVLSGCITEEEGGIFKKPTKESLESALTSYVKITYNYLSMKKYELAMVNAQKALEIDSSSAKAITALAAVYQAQEDFEQARKQYKKAISKDSEFSPARLNYGQFLFKRKEYKEACKQFKKSSEDETYEKRYAAYFNYGLCLSALDSIRIKVGETAEHSEEIERAFRKVLILREDYQPAALELMSLYFNDERYQESKRQLNSYAQAFREVKKIMPARAIWLAIQLERIADNKDAEHSLVLLLKNIHPYSKEYALYKKSIEKPTEK